jgi:charged multivesicular body protein 4A/B
MTLETQLNALESANFNAQTLAALSNSQKALKQVHKDLNITNVDSILDEMREQIETAQAIQEAISAPMAGETIDEVSYFPCNAYVCLLIRYRRT